MKTKEDWTKSELVKIGLYLREIRIQKGYSNYENFAYESGIPRAQYGRYEKGQDMQISSLLKVLKALDISSEDFFLVKEI